jgi:hypothetical protein
MVDRIIIEGDEVRLQNGDQHQDVLTVEQFIEQLSQVPRHPLREEAIPDNIKWLETFGKLTICVVELKPELRWVQWIRDDSPVPYGPKAVCSARQLATPYVILFVPFVRARPVSRIQVFYRNEPLRTHGGDGGMLFWPNLLNVSPHAYNCLSWFCSLHMKWGRVARGLTGSLDEVVHHLWGGQFNRSSEAHEGDSTMSKALKDGIDPRVTNVDRWEEESQNDPRFVLSVDWKSTGVTVKDLIEQEIKVANVNTRLTKTADLANLMLRRRKPR